MKSPLPSLLFHSVRPSAAIQPTDSSHHCLVRFGTNKYFLDGATNNNVHKIVGFFDPLPPCLHLELFYTIKFMQPPFYVRFFMSPSPLFFIFCLEFKIEFSPTYFGAFSYFLRLMIWNFSSFLSFFIQLSQGQSSPTYFDSSAYFFNFYCLVTKLVFNHFCQNIEHEFETWYQQQWLKWLGRHCFNAMIEWIVESLPRKWILLEYKLIWFMFH